MLLQIKAYLSKRPVANLQQIADDLAIDIDVAKQMLACWMRRGFVRSLAPVQGCASGGCGQCPLSCGQSQAQTLLYCWQDSTS